MAYEGPSAEEIAKANAKYAKTSGTGGNELSAAFKDMPGVAKAASAGMSGFTTAIGKGAEGYQKMEKAVGEGVDTFRDLSKSGASFSNDVVGMSAAASGTRMSLSEFADTVKNNAANFAGLGGNVTRGAEVFAKMSKDMADSGATDYLKQMGYTSKDINEVLATQVSFQRSTMANDAEAQKRAISAATKLAIEMDEMAKLTGKSRKEQEENMKKAAADMQVEAKMRLIGLKEGPDAEKKAREMYAKQYNEAELRGQGQMFKEVFATGAVQSKEAGMQVAMQGKAALDTISQAKATARGDTEAAKKANDSAKVSMDKLQNSSAFLTAAVTGVGEASKSAQTAMTSNRGAYDSARAVREDPKMKGASPEQVQEEMSRRAKEAQAGKDKDGKDVSGATKAVIQLGNRAGDVNSALMNGIVKPLNEKVSPALSQFADKQLKAGQNIRTDGGKGPVKATTFATNLEESAKKGFDAGVKEQETGVSEKKPAGWKGKANQAAGNAAGGIMEGIGNIAGNVGSITAKTIDTLNIDGKAIPGRATGSIGMTGGLFEDFGKGALTMLHGKEAVLTEDQMKNMAKGFQGKGVDDMGASITSAMQQAMPKGNPMAGLDTSGIVLGANGMPMPGSLKAKASSIAQEPAKKEAEAKATAARQSEAAKTASTKTADAKSSMPGKKETSLDDVVSKLDSLNKTMSRLLATSEDIGNKQVKATKSVAAGGNLFAR